MPEVVLIDSRQLAELLSMSKEFINKNRHRIIGAQKVGRVWRFHKQQILDKVETGQSILF